MNTVYVFFSAVLKFCGFPGNKGVFLFCGHYFCCPCRICIVDFIYAAPNVTVDGLNSIDRGQNAIKTDGGL